MTIVKSRLVTKSCFCLHGSYLISTWFSGFYFTIKLLVVFYYTRHFIRSIIRFDRSINKFKLNDCSYEFITVPVNCVINRWSFSLFTFDFPDLTKHLQTLHSTYRLLKQVKKIDLRIHVPSISLPSSLGSIISPSDLLSDNFCVLNRQRLNSRGLFAICLAMCSSYGNLSYTTKIQQAIIRSEFSSHMELRDY